ncbi:MAG: vitamin B12-dependent ribonucleotide reductase [Deltaproteobacteria bacterium]|nr:vitamin B12-dependent ribonucleotide reductase [Deltaproteobacteria bacterium]
MLLFGAAPNTAVPAPRWEAAKGGSREVAPAKKAPAQAPGAGVTLDRRFTAPGEDPMDQVEWELRSASIKGDDGRDVFRQDNIEFPKFYSQSATNVIASKYFRGTLGTPNRERSVRTMISRVVDGLTEWGRTGGYFANEEVAATFHAELTYLILHQYGTFNSPVWFNVGVEKHPQCSACFINSVDDTMESILSLVRIEGMGFKFGSGTGTNFSPLRSSKELLRGGGKPSGPVSFMKGYDAFAGVIKSGGKTRRAAKMVILNADHPDIVEFVESKMREERKALALIAAGYDGSFGGEAYESVFFQNANHSVRVTDDFMRAVDRDGEWQTRAVTSGRVMDTCRARDLMQSIAEAAHACGDPGMQFDTTVNDWHTCPNSGRINASNPCSEFMFLDNSACNLASLNLMRFLRDDGTIDAEAMKQAVRVFILAQEIIVSAAAYPTEPIGTNSDKYRPLGLGYANLGAVLMQWGLPYDSEAGRAMAAAMTALMTGEAYAESARVSAAKGPFSEYAKNREPMLRVIRKHREAIDRLPASLVQPELLAAARASWDDALATGEKHGFRNAQVSLLAPTGTIGFKMDCDTTGIEPEMAIVKYKSLVGGGTMKIVNQTVPIALRRLGYEEARIREILQYMDDHDTIEGAPGLKAEHVAVFDCAFKPAGGLRSISVDGHIRMMAAVQPYLSGAISKTVNMPNESTVEDVSRAYVDAWRMGLKAIAIYRDGSKKQQPVNVKKGEDALAELTGTVARERRKLPDERQSITHKFSIAGLDGYITVGMYEDGSPGEIFVTMAKQGSVISGLMDSFATSISIALQYGVPLDVLIDKFSHVRFEPSGFSTNPQIGYAKSIVDYIFRWLATKFLRPGARVSTGDPVTPDLEAVARDVPPGPSQNDLFQGQEDAPPCPSCGWVMVRSGACYKCLNCGGTSGCS